MEEWMIYFGLAALIGLVLLLITLSQKKSGKEEPGNDVGAGAGGERIANRRQQNARLAAQVRNRRGGPAPGQRRIDDSDSENENQDEGARRPGAAVPTEAEEALLNDPKLGAKKRAKLEAKAEKRAQREVEERLREERKQKENKEMEERKKREEQEELEEKTKEEEEKRLREEQAQRELEEYMKMKAAFTVEEEGCEVLDTEEDQNLIEKFITYIKENKVILFEELATKFGLKVPETIDRLNTLVKEGRITGVMDDRGKFIYISEAELGKFAKFIKQRGRVSIVELIENSSDIITLVPDTPSVLSS